MEEKGYHKLQIWKKSVEVVKSVYKITNEFPQSEKNGLVSQIRRAAVSVTLNIVEGHRRSRESNKEFIRFLNISDGSLVEVESCLELALELGFLTHEEYSVIESNRRELAIMLTAFIKSIKLRSPS